MEVVLEFRIIVLSILLKEHSSWIIFFYDSVIVHLECLVSKHFSFLWPEVTNDFFVIAVGLVRLWEGHDGHTRWAHGPIRANIRLTP